MDSEQSLLRPNGNVDQVSEKGSATKSSADDLLLIAAHNELTQGPYYWMSLGSSWYEALDPS